MSRLRGRRDSGQATLELIAMLPVVLVLVGVLLQLGAVVWAITDTTEAARQGARASSMGQAGCSAARAALSGSLQDVGCTEGGGRVQLQVLTPVLVDELPQWTITRTAVLPDVSDR